MLDRREEHAVMVLCDRRRGSFALLGCLVHARGGIKIEEATTAAYDSGAAKMAHCIADKRLRYCVRSILLFYKHVFHISSKALSIPYFPYISVSLDAVYRVSRENFLLK